MANTYVAPNFSVDTSCNIAALEVLKGSALATTDTIYVHSSATLTVEKTIALNSFFINDNAALNAAVKTGYIVSTTGGITITLHSTTLYAGLTGVTGTGNGFYSFVGSSGSPITIISNTATKVSDYNVRSCPNVYKYCVFNALVFIGLGTVFSVCENCSFINCTTYAVVLYAAPLSFESNSVTDQPNLGNPIYCGATTIPFSNLSAILDNMAIIRTTNSNVTLTLATPVLIGTTYFHMTQSTTRPVTQLDRIDQVTQMMLTLMVEKG